MINLLKDYEEHINLSDILSIVQRTKKAVEII